jgi:hypothetical protein
MQVRSRHGHSPSCKWEISLQSSRLRVQELSPSGKTAEIPEITLSVSDGQFLSRSFAQKGLEEKGRVRSTRPQHSSGWMKKTPALTGRLQRSGTVQCACSSFMLKTQSPLVGTKEPKSPYHSPVSSTASFQTVSSERTGRNFSPYRHTGHRVFGMAESHRIDSCNSRTGQSAHT